MKKSIKSLALGLTFAVSMSAFAVEPTDRSTMTDVGDVVQFGVPIAAAAVAWMKGDTEGLVQHAEGAFYTGIATQTLKHLVDAERPNGGSNSWPSGHTSAAMQGAAFLQYRYGWEYGVPATAAALFVGYSRIDANYHHPRDVLAGTALAWGTQYLISEMGISPTKVLISPFVSDEGDGFGLQLSSNF